MPIWRKLGLGVLSPLFIFLLFATAFDVGFIRTATHPATIKKLVAESGIYDSVVPSLLQQTKTINTSVGSISTDNPIVKNAANSVISPQYVKQNGEAAIDNIYQWLGGKISQPTFNFNLAAQQGAFANNVASSVQQQLAALPTCTNAQSLEIIRSGSFDSFNAACLPRGVSPAAAAGQVKDALSNNQDFASNLNLGAANIKNGSDNQSVFEQPGVKNLLKLYQDAKKTPAILVILTILTGMGIVLLSRSWQTGLRHIGINLVVIGVVTLVFSWALNRAVTTQLVPKIKVDNAVLQQDIRNLVTDLGQQIDKNYWIFGGVYAALGAAAIAGAQIASRPSANHKRLDKVEIDLAPHPNK